MSINQARRVRIRRCEKLLGNALSERSDTEDRTQELSWLD